MNLEDHIEALAELEHDRWAHWQAYLQSQCFANVEGTLTIPADLVARWNRQIVTPYDDLSEKEKESDREQVRRWLPFVQRLINETST